MSTMVHIAAELPAYSARQASHYVGVPYATVRAWTGSTGLVRPQAAGMLSFNNLAEIHILKAMRKTHKLSLQSIRRALAELSQIRQTPHPLLDEVFSTDGVDLCLREEDQVLNLTKRSQAEIREFAELYLRRIERDASGRAAKLYPFIARDAADEPRHVSISPAISFGHPVLAGTGVATAVIAGRFTARDSMLDLAKEYDVPLEALQDAIRWEMLKGKAA